MALIFDVLLVNEEIRIHRNALRKKQYRRIQRNLRDNSNPFELPDITFIKLFRLDKETCQSVIHSISEYMQDSQRLTFVPKHLRVLCTLHFLGHGSYQTPTGQLHQIALSQPMVSRSIAEVSDLIVNHLLQRYIIFPVGENRNRVQETFNQEFPHFNGLCGVIDCTQIKIISPPVNHAVYPAAPYYCRKGYYSINTQIICDANKLILNMNARFPGSTHDAAIWLSSQVKTLLRQDYVNGGNTTYLIGDSGYPLEPWLLVPHDDPADNSPESRFNTSLSSARILIEHTNGLIKARFRCLLGHRALHFDPIRAANIIYSCGVLHNLAVQHRIELPEDDVIINPNDNVAQNRPNLNVNGNQWLQAGMQIRNNITQQFFV